MPTRTARTAWDGGLKDGSGQVELTSSGLGTFDVSFPKKHVRAAQSKARYDSMSTRDRETELKTLEKGMIDAAKNLEFERAAELRDRLFKLREQLFGIAVTK